MFESLIADVEFVGADGDDIGQSGDQGRGGKIEVCFESVGFNFRGILVVEFGGVLAQGTCHLGELYLAIAKRFESVEVVIEFFPFLRVERLLGILHVIDEEVHEVAVGFGFDFGAVPGEDSSEDVFVAQHG